LISPCVLLSFWFISCIDYHLKLVWVSYVALLLVLPLWLPFLIWLLPSRNYLCAMIVENLLILDDFTRWCFISPRLFVALLSIVRLHFIIYFTWLCSWCRFVLDFNLYYHKRESLTRQQEPIKIVINNYVKLIINI